MSESTNRYIMVMVIHNRCKTYRGVSVSQLNMYKGEFRVAGGQPTSGCRSPLRFHQQRVRFVPCLTLAMASLPPCSASVSRFAAARVRRFFFGRVRPPVKFPPVIAHRRARPWLRNGGLAPSSSNPAVRRQPLPVREHLRSHALQHRCRLVIGRSIHLKSFDLRHRQQFRHQFLHHHA